MTPFGWSGLFSPMDGGLFRLAGVVLRTRLMSHGLGAGTSWLIRPGSEARLTGMPGCYRIIRLCELIEYIRDGAVRFGASEC